MNLLTIIILLVLLVFAINGYMRGFARTLTSLLFFVFSGVLVYYSTPYVNDFLKTQTPVYSFVESKCETLVEDAIMDKLDKETQKFAQQSDVPRKDQNKIIKSLPIPKELQTQLLDNNNSYTYANMAVQTFSEYISTYLADINSFAGGSNVKFVTGESGYDIDNDDDWNAYVKQITDMHLNEVLGAYQAAYSRYLEEAAALSK